LNSFFVELDSAFGLYLVLLAVSAFCYALLSRPSALAWFDPWVPQQVLAAFASTVVSFMAWYGIVPVWVAAYHWASMLAFYGMAGLSLKACRGSSRPLEAPPIREVATLKRQAFTIYVLAQIAAWATTGVPLLLASRLDAFAGGSGLGLLSRAISFLSIAVIFLNILEVGLRRSRGARTGDWLVLGFIVMAVVLNASKSNIVFTILFALTCDRVCRYLYPAYRPLNISRATYVKAFAVVGSLLVFALLMDARSSDEGSNPLYQLGIRLLLSGDGYLWFYGDDYLHTVTVGSPTKLLFADFLGSTRLVAWSDLPVHPGLQVFQDLFPDSDSIRGPNVRVDTFGLLFGSAWAGILFCTAAGTIFGLCRAAIFRWRTLAMQCVAIYVLLESPQLLVDPVLGVTMFVNATLGAALMAIISTINARLWPRQPRLDVKKPSAGVPV
jgi:hypothetical protein